ncbi:helix-turn-helix domain-containing protein [Arthrobacter sp. zg-Y1110]|uniref:helix-turn-helix domain-containing protein n=1 Tax=Arthrobacter sp. zg-Y1110 TaxID=2886932 RepID=UPI001D14CAA2|nr:helix-turn-helix domain-containing protein [Arthrobacter sp. zg-Y1110]MCC3292808.1 helix-turn-helix domain-containing protein [Arthrobacter sp. zg-Y1110]UWX86748.1 helix-turn-helix domain-containing protein [Arthrobacter sp. zg-Y1110]
MNEFASTAEAYRKARERSSVAVAFEARLLHSAVQEARQAGMSVREAAAALCVSKSTADRHWREGHGCTEAMPARETETAWMQAYEEVWAHSPEMLANPRIPREWREGEGVRTVKAQPAAVLAACAGGVCGSCERCTAAAAESLNG